MYIELINAFFKLRKPKLTLSYEHNIDKNTKQLLKTRIFSLLTKFGKQSLFEMLPLMTYCAVLCQFEQTTIAINGECLRQSQFQNNV